MDYAPGIQHPKDLVSTPSYVNNFKNVKSTSACITGVVSLKWKIVAMEFFCSSLLHLAYLFSIDVFVWRTDSIRKQFLYYGAKMFLNAWFYLRCLLSHFRDRKNPTFLINLGF